MFEQGRGGGGGTCGDTCAKKSSRDFVNNSDPVVPAATASEGHKNDLIQRERNSVCCHVVLDVICNALAEALNGEPE